MTGKRWALDFELRLLKVVLTLLVCAPVELGYTCMPALLCINVAHGALMFHAEFSRDNYIVMPRVRKRERIHILFCATETLIILFRYRALFTSQHFCMRVVSSD